MRLNLNSFFYLFLFALCGSPILVDAQTANEQVPPYPSEVFFGTNMGYFPGWTDEDLATISKGDPAKGVEGIGTETLRPALFGHFLEQWGYDARIAAFKYYQSIGIKDIVCFIGEPSKEQRETKVYCPDVGPSNHYKDLYEPIWDNGENGTPVNENNDFALYVYKTVSLYKDYVKIWEIWNEPDLADRDFKGHSMAPPGTSGSWWDNNPDPCEYKMRAPVFHYIRTLRIAYEVIKRVQPDALVATGGVGYPSFVDAMCRNTDNPDEGKVTAEYPLGGGAYFDVLSFHCYPHIDGSLKKWNMSKFRHDLFRHTDKAAQGVVDAKYRFDKVLKSYGYNGQKYPEKHWILTEVNIPRIPLNNQLGSDEAQRNFIIKSVVLSKRENIRQYHIYNLAEASPHDMQVNLTEFNAMGVYQSLLDIPKYEMKLTEGGLAYKTTAQLLGGMYFDFDKTANLGLDNSMDGGVFSDELGRSVIVVWAKTSIDNSEEANGTFKRKGEWMTQDLVLANWDYAKTKELSPIQTDEIKLTGAPVFIFMPDAKNVMSPSKAIDIIQGVGDSKVTVNYNIKQDGFADIDLINSSGKRIRTILDQEEVRMGTYNVQFSKKGIKPGVYFVRMIIGQKMSSEKIVIQ